MAQEILRSFGEPSERISGPAEAIPFNTERMLYKPEVLTCKEGVYRTEENKVFSGNIVTVNSLTQPSVRHNPEENTAVEAPFSETDPVKLGIRAASLLGRYFILRQADAICISNEGPVPEVKLREISFSILQATDARITRTRYLSCPTCGRTKFNLQEAVRKVKEATGHLTGLKIAVMGCIVNGPGEMAGSDYGYVGAAEGKVHIYRGTVPVLKNVPEEDAVKELLRIIEQDNN